MCTTRLRPIIPSHVIIAKKYIVIHGLVCDVTGFTDDHPGGPEILAGELGKDCTELFEDVFHSDDARHQVLNWVVGVSKMYRKYRLMCGI